MMLWVNPRLVLLTCAVLIAVAFPYDSASAQLGGFGTSRVTLIADPAYPTPGGEVQISLSDYGADTEGSSVSWYADGVLLPQFQNERTARVTAGELGERIEVEAVLSTATGGALSAKTTLTPVAVDLVLEADTYVPAFYRGRALPSPDSQARAVALVHDGTNSPASLYTYTWSIDGTVLFGGPLRGKRAVDVPMKPFSEILLSVKVTNDSGDVVGEQNIIVESVDPEIIFYEFSPLRGLLERAIGKRYPLIGGEVSVYGEPYFLHTGVKETDANFVWEVNGDPVNTSSDAPNALTLQQVGSAGESSVRLEVITKEDFPQVAERSFLVFFE